MERPTGIVLGFVGRPRAPEEGEPAARRRSLRKYRQGASGRLGGSGSGCRHLRRSRGSAAPKVSRRRLWLFWAAPTAGPMTGRPEARRPRPSSPLLGRNLLHGKEIALSWIGNVRLSARGPTQTGRDMSCGGRCSVVPTGTVWTTRCREPDGDTRMERAHRSG